MKKTIRAIFAALVCAIFLAGCGEDETAKAPAKIEGYKTGEEIALKSVFGKDLTLKRVEGGFVIKGDEDKILMFDIFGTFCPPCQKEAPDLTKFQIDNLNDFTIVALTHFENVTNEYVVENFAQKYNAFYFISNDIKTNDRLAAQILEDIKYELKGGVYQELTDVDSGKPGVKYYLGGIRLDAMTKDYERIKNAR